MCNYATGTDQFAVLVGTVQSYVLLPLQGVICSKCRALAGSVCCGISVKREPTERLTQRMLVSVQFYIY